MRVINLTQRLASDQKMINILLPTGARAVANNLSDMFEDIRFSALCHLICFFLLNCHSISDLVRRAPFSLSVSSLSKAAKSFPINRFRRRLLSSILRSHGGAIDPQNFAFVIDDTSNPKSGKRIFNKGVWGGSQGLYSGQKIMLLSLVNLKTHASFPLTYMILPKRESKTDKSAIDHALELVKLALNEGYPKLTVIADSWFDSVKLMANLNEINCHFVVEIKSNRKVKSNPGVNVKPTTLQKAFEDVARIRTITDWDSLAIRRRKRGGKVISEIAVQLTNRTTPVKCIAVYNRKNSVSPFAYYVSTDRSISRARIWMLSRARWSIECIFRTLKQGLSFGRLSCIGEEAAHLAVAMPLYLYGRLRLEPPEFWGLTQLESPDRMLGKISAVSLQKSLDILIGNPNHDRVKTLRYRRSVDRANRKPYSRPAGEASAA